MPRKVRVEYPGAIYHVLSRGDRREDIFLDDVDRQDFLKTLAEAGQKTGFEVHAYCLMRSHFPLVVETPNANLHRWMKANPAPATPANKSKAMRPTTNHTMGWPLYISTANWKEGRNNLVIYGSDELLFDE